LFTHEKETDLSETTNPNLSGVPETLLIPLYIRAKESQRPDAMLKDNIAVALVNQLDYDFIRIKLQGHDELAIILRLREFDRFTRDFLANHPDGVVIHIGCGLDTRFERVDNGCVEWYDLDLPDVIELRRNLISEQGKRYHMLNFSVFDPAWIEKVDVNRPRPFLFIAEGVFPYFKEAQIQWLVRMLKIEFPNAELVFDAHTPFVVWADNQQLAFSKVEARLHFALKHGRDVETWGPGIRLLEEWFYFTGNEPRVRPYRWMSRIPFIAKSTGIFHYRLGTQS
jgi:O-methyltransferase involved in polyketide biosynthesis